MWIGLSESIPLSELEAALRVLFPERSVGVFYEFPEHEFPEIWATLSSNESEFPLAIHMDSLPYNQTQNLVLAKAFSNYFKCRTICDGSGLGDDNSPYWSIIWDDGHSYLADDCGTVFGDGEGGDVRIVRELHLQLP